FLFSSRRGHTSFSRDWSSDVCSSDLTDMLPENRFEIEFIGHVDVGRYRFRVTVNHNSLVTRFLSCSQAMNARIVKFDSLSNTVWSRAENHYFPTVGHH